MGFGEVTGEMPVTSPRPHVCGPFFVTGFGGLPGQPWHLSARKGRRGYRHDRENALALITLTMGT